MTIHVYTCSLSTIIQRPITVWRTSNIIYHSIIKLPKFRPRLFISDRIWTLYDVRPTRFSSQRRRRGCHRCSVPTALCKTHRAQINEICKSTRARAQNRELVPNECKRNSTDCHCAQITRDLYNIYTYTLWMELRETPTHTHARTYSWLINTR